MARRSDHTREEIHAMALAAAERTGESQAAARLAGARRGPLVPASALVFSRT